MMGKDIQKHRQFMHGQNLDMIICTFKNIKDICRRLVILPPKKLCCKFSNFSFIPFHSNYKHKLNS